VRTTKTDERVYAVERQVQWFYDNVPSRRANISGVELQLEPEARFGDLEGIRRYVERVQAMPAVLEAFPAHLHRPVRVRERQTGHAAHYKLNVIAVNTRGDGWAMRELVILHELAHHYADTPGHGPKFIAAEVELFKLVMGPQVSLALRLLFDQHNLAMA